jgi:hypothetical protein
MEASWSHRPFPKYLFTGRTNPGRVLCSATLRVRPRVRRGSEQRRQLARHAPEHAPFARQSIVANPLGNPGRGSVLVLVATAPAYSKIFTSGISNPTWNPRGVGSHSATEGWVELFVTRRREAAPSASQGGGGRGRGGDPPAREVARSEEGEPPVDLPHQVPPRGMCVWGFCRHELYLS